jgi:hypothetical protein
VSQQQTKVEDNGTAQKRAESSAFLAPCRRASSKTFCIPSTEPAITICLGALIFPTNTGVAAVCTESMIAATCRSLRPTIAAKPYPTGYRCSIFSARERTRITASFPKASAPSASLKTSPPIPSMTMAATHHRRPGNAQAATIPLAGFELITYGRFSGDNRGISTGKASACIHRCVQVWTSAFSLSRRDRISIWASASFLSDAKRGSGVSESVQTMR